jgi:hypothetical protein
MDEIIRRSQAQLAKCLEQIEQSHKVIEDTRRWLTAYWASLNREQQSLSISEGEHPISAPAREPVI